MLVTLLLGRLAHPLAGLAIVILAAEQTESFGVAGVAYAAWLGCSGLGCLVTGRLVDRGHARPALRATAVLSGLMLALLALTPHPSVSEILALTAVAGLSSPPIVPATRALWAVLLPATAARASMSALDASAQELTYIIGPAVAGATAVWSPRIGVALAAGLCVAGAELFSIAPGLQQFARAREASPGRVDPRKLAAPLAVSALLTAAFSFTEVAVVAAADQAGAMAASGALLAVWGVGSLFAGVLAGAHLGRGSPERWLLWLLLGIAASTASYAAVPNLLLLGIALALGGAMIAPALAAIDALVIGSAPAGAIARTFAAVAAAGLGGSAAGGAVAGVVAQMHGPATVFLLGAAAAGVAALFAVLSSAVVSRRRKRFDPIPDRLARAASSMSHGSPIVASPTPRGSACCGRRPCWEAADAPACVPSPMLESPQAVDPG